MWQPPTERAARTSLIRWKELRRSGPHPFFSARQVDALRLLKSRGGNAFRMRLWNSPCAAGQCNASRFAHANLTNVLRMARGTGRCTARPGYRHIVPQLCCRLAEWLRPTSPSFSTYTIRTGGLIRSTKPSPSPGRNAPPTPRSWS